MTSEENQPPPTSVRLLNEQDRAIKEVIKRSGGRLKKVDVISAAIDWYTAELLAKGKPFQVKMDDPVADVLSAEDERRKKSNDRTRP